MARIQFLYVVSSTICIVLLTCYTLLHHTNYSSTETDTPSTDLANYDDEILLINEEPLICEKVYENVLQSRIKSFTAQLDPTHVVINEFLEILSENKTICNITNQENTDNSTNPSRLLVVIVNSARSHFNERQIIRQTWAYKLSYSAGWQVRTIFLVGQSDYCLQDDKSDIDQRDTVREEDENLAEEQQKYGDLVIGTFSDTYRNNTYKHLMGFKFVLERCQNAEFIVKTDDDTFVNIPLILGRRIYETKQIGDSFLYDIYCKKVDDDGPKRCHDCVGGKWFATFEEWPTEMYPAYCPGWSVAMSMEWVKMLYAVKNMGGFFWMDDVFITGKLREIAEKEFGVTARMLAVNKRAWKGDKGFCSNLTRENVKERRLKLAMFAHLNRTELLEEGMKCLTDISFGRYFETSSSSSV